MSDGILCQGCGIEAPLKYATFNQNIGMLVARRSSYIRGHLCKNCVHSHFWSKTGTTLAVGWLGTISIILAPAFIVGNVVRYLTLLGMPPVPPDAQQPALTEHAIAGLTPLREELIGRLNRGEQLGTVARELAPRAGVTPGQVVVYVRWIASTMRQQQPTYGFPVQPLTPAQALPLPPLNS